METWNLSPRSICRYGSKSEDLLHHEPFPDMPLRRPWKGSNPTPIVVEEIMALSEMILSPIPNESKQAKEKKIYNCNTQEK